MWLILCVKLTDTNILCIFVNQNINRMNTSIFSIRLSQARLMNGWSMDQLSEKTSRKVTKQSISKYEKGLMLPKKDTLAALSSALDISIDYFLGTGMSIDTPMLRKAFNGYVSDEEVTKLESMLAYWSEQYITAESKAGMLTCFVNPLKDKVVSTIEDACDAADSLRRAWNCGDGALPSVLRLMERKGIKILDRQLPCGVLGLSTWADHKYPLVVIDFANEKHTVERLRFTASHELGHIVLNIPRDVEPADREKLCSQFAGCFLLPKTTLIEELGGTKRARLTLDELIDLHEEYGVSVSALVHEAWDLRIITREHYDLWYNEQIHNNCKEIGWGEYLFPETLGREKRVRSNLLNNE